MAMSWPVANHATKQRLRSGNNGYCFHILLISDATVSIRSLALTMTMNGAGCMKFFAATVLLAGTFMSASAESVDTAAATAAAISWLDLLDSGKYAESWEQAAAVNQAAIPKANWESSLSAARNPLGKNLSRVLKSAVYSNNLTGAPEGEYVIIRFASSFEHVPNAMETVTPMKQKDGSWKVSGYFVK